MTLSKFSTYRYALFLVTVILVCGCTDNTIEGLSGNSGVFSVSKSSYSNTVLNDCYISSSANYGTTIIVKLEYQGSEVVNKVGYSYKFSTGSTGTVASVSYTDSKSSGSSGTFRGTSGLSNLQISHCIRFGTSTSIEYTYTITTTLNKTYTSVVTVTKPVGAN